MQIPLLKLAVLSVVCVGALWAQAQQELKLPLPPASFQRINDPFWQPKEAQEKGYYLGYREGRECGGDGRGVFQTYLDNPAVVGVFTHEFVGYSCLVLLKEDGRYFVDVTGYDESFAHVPIPDEMGRAMEAVLKNEIFNITTYKSFGADGVQYNFGIKQDERWHNAAIWCPPKNSIGYLMGAIADLGHCDMHERRKPNVYVRDNWGKEKLPKLAKILRDIDAFYGEDKRPRLDYEAARAYEEEIRASVEKSTAERKREAEALGIISLEGKVNAEIIVPETGDLRLKLSPCDLPQGHDLRVNTTETRYAFYFALDYLDENGKAATRHGILRGIPRAKDNIVPLAPMEVPLEEISPLLREMILKICPDPEKVQGLSLMVATLQVFQPLDKEKLPAQYSYYNPGVIPSTALQVLPIENVRKNLRVKSTPLSHRDKSQIIQQDEQGRLTEFVNKRGDHYKIAFNGETDESYKSTDGIRLYDIYEFLPGVARVERDGAEVYAARVLENGLVYYKFRRNKESLSFCLRDNDAQTEVSLYGHDGSYALRYVDIEKSFPSKCEVYAKDLADAPESPEALRAWKERFEALRVSVEMETENGVPCFYLVIENTTGKPIELNKSVVFDDMFMLHKENGASSSGCLGQTKLDIAQTTLAGRCRIKIDGVPAAMKRAIAHVAERDRQRGEETPPHAFDWCLTIRDLEKNAPSSKIQRTTREVEIKDEAFKQFCDYLQTLPEAEKTSRVLKFP